jgi:hypothetical protein
MKIGHVRTRVAIVVVVVIVKVERRCFEYGGQSLIFDAT